MLPMSYHVLFPPHVLVLSLFNYNFGCVSPAAAPPCLVPGSPWGVSWLGWTAPPRPLNSPPPSALPGLPHPHPHPPCVFQRTSFHCLPRKRQTLNFVSKCWNRNLFFFFFAKKRGATASVFYCLNPGVFVTVAIVWERHYHIDWPASTDSLDVALLQSVLFFKKKFSLFFVFFVKVGMITEYYRTGDQSLHCCFHMLV